MSSLEPGRLDVQAADGGLECGGPREWVGD